MGNVTADLLIWTPDEFDSAEPDIYLASMAESLEDGVGDRLRLQEIAVGLKASLGNGTLALTSAFQVLPYTVSAGVGDFNNGFTLSGGVATVQTPGMYTVTASVGASTGTARGLKIRAYKNSTVFALAEVPQTSTIWVNAQVSCVLNCVEGDTIKADAAWTGAGGGSTNVMQPEANFISIAMVQAIPV